MEINSVSLIPIFNSIGDRTFKAVINGQFSASAPSGISKSSFEKESISAGQSMKVFEKIKTGLSGFHTQESFDIMLEKSSLGNNAKTALSLAFFGSSRQGNSFPHVLGNVIGGGLHSKNSIRIQEILVVKKSRTMEECIETNFLVWKEIGKRLQCGMGHEGAWAPEMSDEDALEIAEEVASSCKARIGIDMAASSIYNGGKYCYPDCKLDREGQIDYMIDLAKKFRLYYIEDPVQEKDAAGYREVKRKTKSIVSGDDIIATDTERIIRNKSGMDAVIIKPNQAVTISRALKAIETSCQLHISPVVSHRSAETEDSTLSILATHAPLAKLGIAGIRIAKLNRLVELWHSADNPKMAAMPKK